MVEAITMPQLGESVTEGTIERWLVKPGDVVKKYEPLAEVMTDKVSAEIPSSFAGTVQELLAVEGETYAVGTVVCTIDVAQDGAQAPAEQADAPKKDASPSFLVTSPPAAVRYSPAVLSLAAKHAIDVTTLTGSGAGGRVTRKDVLRAVQQPRSTPATASEPAPAPKSAPTMQTSAVGDVEIPVTGVRKAIAHNMKRSMEEIPHAWMMVEVDVTELVNYRQQIKETFAAKEGFPITYFPFFVKAVTQALKEYPMMNAIWTDEKIIQKKDINISIAVGTEDALYVPVIHHADEKSVKGIAKDIYELAALARAQKLTHAHVSGGTFTVNNTGVFGSIQSKGIIQYPQAAILQVESIVKKPVLIQGDMMAARHIVNICLSFDHRILDGYICGKFLGRVKKILENSDFAEMSVY